MEERLCKTKCFGEGDYSKGIWMGRAWLMSHFRENLENFGDRDFHTPSFQEVKSQDTRMTSKYRLSIESYCNSRHTRNDDSYSHIGCPNFWPQPSRTMTHNWKWNTLKRDDDLLCRQAPSQLVLRNIKCLIAMHLSITPMNTMWPRGMQAREHAHHPNQKKYLRRANRQSSKKAYRQPSHPSSQHCNKSMHRAIIQSLFQERWWQDLHFLTSMD